MSELPKDKFDLRLELKKAYDFGYGKGYGDAYKEAYSAGKKDGYELGMERNEKEMRQIIKTKRDKAFIFGLKRGLLRER